MNNEPIELACTVDVQPGERLNLPEELLAGVGPGRWIVTVRQCGASAEHPPIRRHEAFLRGYAAEDEGLYDDLAR